MMKGIRSRITVRTVDLIRDELVVKLTCLEAIPVPGFPKAAAATWAFFTRISAIKAKVARIMIFESNQDVVSDPT